MLNLKNLMAAAKKILFKLFLFLLPIAICFLYFEYKLRTQHFVSSYATKKYFLEQQAGSIETLILGSSQTFNGIDPSFFSSHTFNLSNVSQTIFYDKRLTLLYFSQMPKLKTVVINIAYFSFFYQLADIKEKWRDGYYRQHFNIQYSDVNRISFDQYSMFFTYNPRHTLSLATHNFEDRQAKEILPNGYQPKFVQELINDKLGQERVLLHNAENFSFRRKEIESDLEDFVRQLHKKHIDVVFLTTPVFTSYSKFCNKKIIDSNTTFINAICNRYNCKYYNFFEDKRFTKNDFFDNDHLKNNGAKKLSVILNDTLRKQDNNNKYYN